MIIIQYLHIGNITQLTGMRKAILYTLLFLIPAYSYADGNASLGNTLNLTACGLNYTQASQRLGQRFNPAGIPQPAAFTISGIPTCANIEKAYLYCEGSGNGVAITATIQGPAGTQNFPMTHIGQDNDKCWGYSNPGSHSYRADVTSAVTGSGTYNISGLPTGAQGQNDMDGATLFVVYSDPSQTWRGTISIDDGAQVGPPYFQTHTMNFSAPCGAPSNAKAFFAIGDLQDNTSTITLNGNPYGAYTFNWYNFFQTNTTITAAQTTSTFSVQSSGDCYNMLFTGIYYQTTTCAVCIPPTTIVITKDSTKTTCDSCNGTATVHATGGTPPYTFSWLPSGGTDSTATGLCPGVYTVTVVSSCGSGSAVINIVQGAGGFTFSSTQTNPECNGYCDGIINMTITGGTAPFTFGWTPPTAGNTATITNLCAGTYSVLITDANHCTGDTTLTITQPAPTPPPTPDNTAFCQFGPSSPLTATPSTPGDVIRWWDVPTGGTFSATPPTPITTVAGTFTWYISDVTPIGCESIRVPITAVIKTKPLFPVVTSASYCQYFTANVLPLAVQGDSVQWYTTPTGGVGTFTAPLPTVDTAGTAIWYVSQTVNGCESDRAPQIVRVNPGVIANFGYDLVLGCGRDTLNLTDSSTVNGTEQVTWDFGDGSPFETFETDPQHLYYNTGTYTVKLLVTNGFCSDSLSKDVYAFVQKVLPLSVSAGVIICPGDTTQLHAYGDPTYIYSWTPPMWIKNSNTADPTVRPENNLVYTASALDTNGCIHIGNVRVTLASNAIISLPDSVTLYPGESYQMDPQGNGLYFSWFPSQGLSADNISNPTAMPEVSTRYVVHASTEWGCQTADSIDIFIDAESILYLPNAFTPGSTGNNTEFKIVKRGLASLNYFRIYDRWGVMVYEGKDIDKGWDGTYKGKPQPFGVYVYMVEATTSTGKKFVKQGNVTLLR